MSVNWSGDGGRRAARFGVPEMGQLKSHEVDGWLAKAVPTTPVVLVYGPDRGLVTERARLYADKCGVPLDDPFSVVRLDAIDIEKQPGRLVDEANTMPMFAGRRLIWVRNALGQKSLAEDVKALCADPPADTLILIEAGDLKKGVGLRAIVEASPAALALPCHADDARAIDAVIDAALGKAGLSIDDAARSVLKFNLGDDRLTTRAQLEKLVLASMGTSRVEMSDVRALAAESSAPSADEMVDAVLAGEISAFDRLFATQVRTSSQTFTVLSALQRQLQSLLVLRVLMETDNRGAGSVVGSARPPVFFNRRRIVEQFLDRRRSRDIAGLLGELQATMLQTRKRADLAVALTHQAMLAVAVTQRVAQAT